jgi:hypothetical protein
MTEETDGRRPIYRVARVPRLVYVSRGPSDRPQISRTAILVRASGDYSLPMGAATAAAVIVAAVPIAALVGLHRGVNGPDSVNIAVGAFLRTPAIWIPALVLGTVAHELIHGVAWARAAGRPLGIIRFGINWKALAPHAQCTVPLPASAYRLGAAAPGLLLGIVPALAGTLSGTGAVAAFGWLMTLGAGGDMVVLWLIRSLPRNAPVQDHPTRAGCVAARVDNQGAGE